MGNGASGSESESGGADTGMRGRGYEQALESDGGGHREGS